MSVRIVTDSACDLTVAQTDELGIAVVPLTIRFGDEELVDREQLSAEQFYAKMATFDGLPETAAPAPGQFEAAFRTAAEQGANAVVCINLSSELSATMASAVNAQKAIGTDLDVRVLDSRSITSGLGVQVLEAARMAADGKSADEIEAAVVDMAARARVYATLANIEALKKGGRIGGAKAFLGTVLSIKPIISIHDAVAEAGKARTRGKSFEWLRDKLAEYGQVEQLQLRHAGATDFDEFVSVVTAGRDPGSFETGYIGPVIGTHAGQGCVGVTFLAPS
jgi:DegV family protein with EDD domain